MSWKEWRFWDYVLVSRLEEDPDFRGNPQQLSTVISSPFALLPHDSSGS